MRWKALIAAALFVGIVSVADAGWRIGNKLIQEGDTMAKVLRIAGEPDMKNRIESEEGGTVGNRWYYVIEGYNAKTVIITFQGGRVVDIQRERERARLLYSRFHAPGDFRSKALAPSLVMMQIALERAYTWRSALRNVRVFRVAINA